MSEEKYLKVKASQYSRIVMYNQYTQQCLKSDPITIPDLFTDWSKSTSDEMVEAWLQQHSH